MTTEGKILYTHIKLADVRVIVGKRFIALESVYPVSLASSVSSIMVVGAVLCSVLFCSAMRWNKKNYNKLICFKTSTSFVKYLKWITLYVIAVSNICIHNCDKICCKTRTSRERYRMIYCRGTTFYSLYVRLSGCQWKLP